jgi:hypothetical protein
VLREVGYVLVDVDVDVDVDVGVSDIELGERLAGGGTAAGGGALAHGKDHMIGLVNGGPGDARCRARGLHPRPGMRRRCGRPRFGGSGAVVDHAALAWRLPTVSDT